MVEELLKLKDMLDKGIITKEEFAAAKEELASKNRTVPIQRKPVSKSGFAPASRAINVPPKSYSKVQCPKCGEYMPSSLIYCDSCGSVLFSQGFVDEIDSENKNAKKAVGAIVFVLAILFLFILVKPIVTSVSDTQNDKKKILQICEQYGLDVQNIFYEMDIHSKKAKIVATNFDSLTYEEMFSLQSKLPFSFSYTYAQNEESYIVDSRNKSITKDGHILYKEQIETASAPIQTESKSLGSQSTPPEWILESIGSTIQNSMKDQDVTYWTSDSGVYITIGMPVNKSDFKVWASTSGRVQFYDFCALLSELSSSAWDVVVHQGYEDSAVVFIEVVDAPNGNLILSYLNGKQSYNFLED